MIETVAAVCLVVLGTWTALALVVAGVCAVVAWVDAKVLAPWETRLRQLEFDRLRRRLNEDANWFSEDEPTMLLLMELAKDGDNISRIRENWRARRAAGASHD